MGPNQGSPDNHDEEAAHRDRVLNDLTIIQAQAQLMMRRIESKRDFDHYDVYERLAVVVEAARRLTQLHR